MLGTSASLNRQDVYVALGIGMLVVFLGYWYMVFGVCGNYHDDAIYVSTAKAIAQGQGYRLINLPGSPVQTKYPFLYPALLAIIWKLWPSFPENLLAMQWLSLLTGAATVAFAYLYLVRFGYCIRGVALTAALLCATSPGFLFFCCATLSDMPFALLSVLALWALDKHISVGCQSRTSQLFLGLLVALPFLCRTVGVVLPLVGLIIVYFSGRPVFWVAAGCLAGMFSWVFWVLVHIGSGGQDLLTTYYTDYVSWWFLFGIGSVSHVSFLNLMRLSTCKLGVEGFKMLLWYRNITVWLKLGTLMSLATLVTMSRQLAKGRLLVWYIIMYLFVICLWPWPPYRFVVPILPFVLAYLLRSIWIVLTPLFSPLMRRYFPKVVASLMIMANIVLVYDYGMVRRQTHYPYPYSVLRGPELSWASYSKVFEWIDKQCQPDDVIACPLDSMIYIYTGQRAFRPFIADSLSMFYGADNSPTGTVEDLIKLVKAYKPRYLVHIPVPGSSAEEPFAELLREFLVTEPGWLQPVYVGDDPRFVIYELGRRTESARQ